MSMAHRAISDREALIDAYMGPRQRYGGNEPLPPEYAEIVENARAEIADYKRIGRHFATKAMYEK